ncbi:hypothetical protein BDK62_1303 [Halomonas alkaliantarctica]|nr:hypothetical protein BDK62_1303 [Halomonas alkaliantarctica]
MARHIVKSFYDENKLVNVESVADKDMSDIITQCLEKVGYSVERKKTENKSKTKSLEQGGEASAGINWLKAKLFSKRAISSAEGETVESEFFVSSPTDSKIIEVCEKNEIILLLDELHRATDSFLEDLVKFIKAYGNSNCDRFKIILLGTSSDPSKLVQKDPGIDRLIEDLHLKSMDDKERRELVSFGMSDLAIDISDPALRKLVSVCVGSPNILQYLCLESSEVAFEREPRKLEISDVDDAIEEYVKKRESRLYRTYMKAIENQGSKRYRKQILRAMSEIEDEYVTMEQIREKVESYLDVEVRAQDLSGALRKLKETVYGPVLRDIDKNDGSGIIQNYTTFIDPALKAFIRMQVLREEIS